MIRFVRDVREIVAQALRTHGETLRYSIREGSYGYRRAVREYAQPIYDQVVRFLEGELGGDNLRWLAVQHWSLRYGRRFWTYLRFPPGNMRPEVAALSLWYYGAERYASGPTGQPFTPLRLFELFCRPIGPARGGFPPGAILARTAQVEGQMLLVMPLLNAAPDTDVLRASLGDLAGIEVGAGRVPPPDVDEWLDSQREPVAGDTIRRCGDFLRTAIAEALQEREIKDAAQRAARELQERSGHPIGELDRVVATLWYIHWFDRQWQYTYYMPIQIGIELPAAAFALATVPKVGPDVLVALETAFERVWAPLQDLELELHARNRALNRSMLGRQEKLAGNYARIFQGLLALPTHIAQDVILQSVLNRLQSIGLVMDLEELRKLVLGGPRRAWHHAQECLNGGGFQEDLRKQVALLCLQLDRANQRWSAADQERLVGRPAAERITRFLALASRLGEKCVSALQDSRVRDAIMLAIELGEESRDLKGDHRIKLYSLFHGLCTDVLVTPMRVPMAEEAVERDLVKFTEMYCAAAEVDAHWRLLLGGTEIRAVMIAVSMPQARELDVVVCCRGPFAGADLALSPSGRAGAGLRTAASYLALYGDFRLEGYVEDGTPYVYEPPSTGLDMGYPPGHAKHEQWKQLRSFAAAKGEFVFRWKVLRPGFADLQDDGGTELLPSRRSADR